MNRIATCVLVVVLAGCRASEAPSPTGPIDDPERIGRLIIELQLPDPDRADKAAQALALSGDAAAHRLLGLAASGPPLAAARALQVLGSIQSPEMIAPICSILCSSPHESVRLAAANALAAYGSPLALGPIAAALSKEPCAEVRVACLRAIEATDDPSAARHALASLEDPAELVRRAALDIVEARRPEGAGDALAAAYAALPAAGAWTEKERILALLVSWRDPHALPLLEDALANPFSSPTRREAARLLGELGDSQAIAALIDAIADARPEVAQAAHASLVRLTGRSDAEAPELSDAASHAALQDAWRRWIQERR